MQFGEAAIGYTLSCEEFGPRVLSAQAVRAERAGFEFAGISDHYHPWVGKQGNSPFVWGVLGAVAQATEPLGLITGVTCPTTRIHSAIVAQAAAPPARPSPPTPIPPAIAAPPAATSAWQLPGRCALCVGTGENLNEHILGDA